MYWIYEILQTARDNGYGTLLTGQGGNATISWTGKNTQKIFTSYYQNRQWKKIVRDLVFPILPISFVKKINARMVRNKLIWENTALRSSFIEQFDLSEKYLASYGTVSNSENWNTARQQRYSIIKPGRWFGGNYHAENGGEYGLDVRDPTLDKRVLEFTIAVPDKEYLGPDGYDRWLIRTAMNGLLPDKVRLNRRRGRQAGDIGYRLLKCSAEVESALSEIRRSELANRYIEIDRLDSVWLSLQHGVDRVNTHHSVTILTRGLMAGLYLSRL
jgi:asparagine synthase (glutamine-hydrolysing)